MHHHDDLLNDRHYIRYEVSLFTISQRYSMDILPDFQVSSQGGVVSNPASVIRHTILTLTESRPQV